MIGECGLDYTEPAHSLPVTAVSQTHCLGQPVGKATCSTLSWEPLPTYFGHKALPILENTYHDHRFHVHCYCGSLHDYQRWVGVFPNSVFGQVLAAGLGELACCIDSTGYCRRQTHHGYHPWDLPVDIPTSCCTKPS